MQKCRLVLADDHVLFLQGLRKILEETDSVSVVGEARDGQQVLPVVRKHRPDMVLLDISMPNIRGLEAISRIKDIDPEIKVLMLTMHNKIEYLQRAVAAGADGYLLKEDADIDLLTAIQTVVRGKSYVSPTLAPLITESYFEAAQQDDSKSHSALTNREREVLQLIAEGQKNREIAECLCISPRTVENHRANMMKKLGVKNSFELLRCAIKKQIISVDDESDS